MAAWEKKWENRSYRFHLSIFWQQAADYKIICLYDDFWKCRVFSLCFGFPSTQTWHFGKNKKKSFFKKRPPNRLQTVFTGFVQMEMVLKMPMSQRQPVHARCGFYECVSTLLFLLFLIFIKLLQFNFRFYFTVTLFHFRTAFRLFSSRYAWS